MMNILKSSLVLSVCLLSTNVFSAGMDSDDPFLTYLKADKFEWRDSDEGNVFVYEIDAWLGYDLEKLWIKASGERVDGEIESQTIDILYNKAVSAYWDLQMGVRLEDKPSPSNHWLGVGFMGVAPYQIEMDVNAFVNEDGLVNFSLSAEYEYMFSQKVELVPEIEMSFYSDDDVARGIESGLANVEIGLRLSYQIEREFAPYIGINFEAADAKEFDTQLLVGVKAWF